MSVPLLVITHQHIGNTLVEQTRRLLGPFTVEVGIVEVGPNDDPVESLNIARGELDRLDHGDGVLILTDVYGATPSNVAHRVGHDHAHAVVHGLNLAMLMRAHNYGDQSLEALVHKVLDGGHRSIFVGEPT